VTQNRSASSLSTVVIGVFSSEVRNGNRAISRSRRCRSVGSRVVEGSSADSGLAIEEEGEVRGFFSRRRLSSEGNVEDADSPRASKLVDHDESRLEVRERCRSFRRQVSGEEGGKERLSNRFEARTSVERLWYRPSNMSVTKAIRAGEIDAPRQFAQFANRFRPITQLVRFEIERFHFR